MKLLFEKDLKLFLKKHPDVDLVRGLNNLHEILDSRFKLQHHCTLKWRESFLGFRLPCSNRQQTLYYITMKNHGRVQQLSNPIVKHNTDFWEDIAMEYSTLGLGVWKTVQQLHNPTNHSTDPQSSHESCNLRSPTLLSSQTCN